MGLLTLGSLGLVANIIVFTIAAAVVWFGGVRLARGADAIADKAGFGHAYIGVFLLGAMVSLPEMTFSSVAAWRGNADLAVNSLLGGIGMTMVVLAIVDCIVGKEPLSGDVQKPIVLFQGTMVILMLATAAAGITVGDTFIPGVGMVGVWTLALLALYAVAIYAAKQGEGQQSWRPTPIQIRESASEKEKGEQASAIVEQEKQLSLTKIIIHTAVAGLAVICAATVLAFNAEIIAHETGLGDSFVGFVFGGIVTTLPELSTTIAAARLKQYEMAFSDGFGTNLFSTGLIFLADAVYRGGPILNEVGTFSVFGVLLGLALTTIYLAGFILRSNRSILRMGYDSHAVLIVSFAGFCVLYSLS